MATQVQIRRGTAAENDAFTGAQGELTYDTTNKRIRIHDGATAGGFELKTENSSGDTLFADNEKAIFGAGSDLQIYHTGSHSIISDSGTGDLKILGQNVEIGALSGELNFKAVATGASTVYYNNSAKLATTSTGIDVTGTVTADGLTVDGNATADAFDLSAIATDISDTAVDVFVYDTSKDSDGGAWRKRCQHTSWYNETLNTSTRGSRKEFPAVAVIVAESNQVTIYDGDDPALPMWMVFNVSSMNMIPGDGGSSPKALAMLNGVLFVAKAPYDSPQTDFITDWSKQYAADGSYKYKGNIAERNSALGQYKINSNTLVSRASNDVAMTVLPNAPIDDATGLPVPTIAVATDGGVSVIKDDGSVVDLTNTTLTTYDYSENVIFDSEGRLVFGADVSSSQRRFIIYGDVPSADASFQVDATDARTVQTTGVGLAVASPFYVKGTKVTEYAHDSVATESGVSRMAVEDTLSNSMVSYITSSYNTGWMNGDIKLATLSDTDDTDVTGSELVTNGTFDSDVSGWSSQLGAVITHTGSAIQVQSTGNNSLAYQFVSADLSKEYILTGDLVSGSGYISMGGTIYSFTSGKLYATLPAGRSNNKLDLSPSTNTTAVFDNISVRLAEPDRSVNGNGLQVHGTVTKSPVATGADLVAYSGFSASNYLEQPYNSDLDFGTGDFCVMGWAKETGNPGGERFILRRTDGTNWSFHINNNQGYYLSVGIGEGNYVTGSELTKDVWNYICFVRRSGMGYLYLDGKLDHTATASVSTEATTNDPVLYFGKKETGQQFQGSLALWRISATAPSPEQIAKIYEDEKVLFQENAAATLYGSSDAVTALAHDPDTDLLHVGTSAGRSVFQGLRRVSNTTTAVGTAISASNSLVVEE